MQNINIYRLIRIARDKKVKDLANDLMVTPAYINAIEKGERVPSVRLVRNYAKILNIDEKIIQKYHDNIDSYKDYEHIMLSLLKDICYYDKIRKEEIKYKTTDQEEK